MTPLGPAAATPNGDTAMYDRGWLHTFALVTRAVTLANAQQNSCILSTRIGLAVLDRYGINARAQAVIVGAFNREAWHLVDQQVPTDQWPASAHSVGIYGSGVSDPVTRSWDGHLVVMVRNPSRTRTLIDLTADQLDRPAKGIDVGGPVFMDLPAMWTPHDPSCTVVGADEAPTILMYRPLMKAGDWKQSPDWMKEPKILDEFVDVICREIDNLSGKEGDSGPTTA